MSFQALAPNGDIILSDGYATESLGDLPERLLSQEVPLDFRLIADDGSADPRIQALGMPARAQPNEPFLITADVAGATGNTLAWSLLQSGYGIRE